MRNLLPSLSLLLLAVLAGQGMACDSGFDSTMAQLLQQSLDRSVSELAIPGAAMAVHAPDGTTWSGASGIAELPAVPMSTDMHFRIASMTKSFTTTMILQLVDEGKLTLDETLDQVMAQWFAPGVIDFAIPYSDVITLRHLMEMRSGMPNYSGTPAFQALLAQQPPPSVTPQELIRMSAQNVDPAPYPPDTRMQYTNTNCIVLGLVIEQVTGNAYADELNRRILTPLGMTHTLYPETTAMPDPYAHGYLVSNGQVQDETGILHPSMGGAAGAIVSTVPDMIRWVTAMVSGSLISPAMQKERMKMLEGTVETWPVLYGLGMYNDAGAIGHYGNYAQLYTAYGMRYGGYDIVVLENGELQEHSDAGRHPARSIFWNAVRDIGIAADGGR